MSSPRRTQRPLRIGLSACFFHADPTRPIFKGKTLLYLEESIATWVGAAGAIAYLVPRLAAGSDAVGDLVEDLDGLVLQGGSDVCPRTYGEEPLEPEWEGDAERDLYEIELVREFHSVGKPVLGVCRGAQLVNVAFGGTLYQDLPTQVGTGVTHRDWDSYDSNRHEISILPGSGLAALFPDRSAAVVNSVHHQAVKDLGDGLVVEAVSVGDGVVEAVRLAGPVEADRGHVFGVQWHPEWLGEDPAVLPTAPILREFLDHAASRRASAAEVATP